MSSGVLDQKLDTGDVEKHGTTKVDLVNSHDLHEKTIQNSELLVNQDLLSSAYDGENREHAMGVWEAVKLHPMACFWAFIFCFTIVRSLFLSIFNSSGKCLSFSDSELTGIRLWSLLTCF
jgi:MFS transporter, SP family, general alpha glucoside:H+ symporter